MQQRQRPAGPQPEEILGWGSFGALLAGVLVALAGGGWLTSALIFGLCLGATGLLWLAGRLADGAGPGPAGRPDQARSGSGRHQDELSRSSPGEGDLGA
jgi:hypothetical protein